MNGLMSCADCGGRFYSAAAAAMVARGERCSDCGGTLAPGEPAGREEEAEGRLVAAGPRAVLGQGVG